MMRSPIIAASILGADPLYLAENLDERCGKYDWIHIDVMDGHFVPNISFGASMVAALRKKFPKAFLDVHLMVEKPENMLDDFLDAADLITFHIEATPHAHRIVQKLHDAGAKAGISMTPSTPVEAILPILPFLELVLVMSVNPGFGGQKFLDFALDKLRTLACYRAAHGLDFFLQMDGGINEDNMTEIVNAGCDVLVMGTSLFKQNDWGKDNACR